MFQLTVLVRHSLLGIVWLGLSGLVGTATPQSPTGSISGTIRLIVGYQVVPLVGARIVVSDVSNDHDEHETVTDKAGEYTVDLPEGTYKMHFAWVDGGCSVVRRAPFRLGAGEHFTFDFLTMHCVSMEAKSEVPREGEKIEALSNAMNVPFAKQGRRYLEQLILAERDRWPEIVVSFGKYDNRVDEIRYFPMCQGVRMDSATAAPLLLSLPVTVTVDRYTLQAMEVVLDKKDMVFTAKGTVFISDGKSGRMGNYATLRFSSGQVVLRMEH